MNVSEQKIGCPMEIERILLRLEQAGFEGYLVGGCVRDRLMGKEPHDYDITTSALPEEMLEVFAEERVIETGLKHGTVTVLTAQGGVEITTYRQDGTYSDHRHPDQVQFTRSLKEDLARRDFTVNAMAMDQKGAIIDPFGGQADLTKKIIRCVGDPRHRFEEDALRILRGLRFSSRLGFTIEEKTAAAMMEKRNLLQQIAKERVFTELCGLLMGKDCRAVLNCHRQVIETVLPELKRLDITTYEKVLHRVENTPLEETLRFAALLLDLGTETAEKILVRLKVSNCFLKTVLLLIREFDVPCSENRIVVRCRCAAMGAEAFLKLVDLWQAAGETNGAFYRRTVKELLEEGACLSLKALAVNGKDLQKLGLSGTEIGNTLNVLFEKVLNEELPNEKQILLAQLE